MSRWLCGYFQRPLDTYFANPSNRHIIYYRLGVYFFLMAIGARILVREQGALNSNFAFLIIYAVHLTLTYIMGMLLVDLLFRRCIPGWGSYHNRTVAKQWLLLWLGFMMGFLFHRLVAIHQIGFYVPWFSAYFGAPQALRPSHWEIFTFIAPAWFFAAFLVIQAALLQQRQPAKSQPPPNLAALPLHKAPALVSNSPPHVAPADATASADPLFQAAEAVISVNNNGLSTDIPVESITHVTVEDHYCRIHYQDQERLCNVLLCAPLKNLADQLPPDTFVQIHRSHLVNLEHVAHLKKSGRQYFLGLDRTEDELPISRNRWAEIRRHLPGMHVEVGH